MRQFRERHAVCLDQVCTRFAFGVLSPQENQVIRDHLVEVVDTAEGPVMVLRSGERCPIEPGATVVNTSGYIATVAGQYEPYLSARWARWDRAPWR